MRVNVAYSVELSELKQIVQELLLKVEDEVENVNGLFTKVQQSVSREQEEKAIKLIEECRASIAKVDHSLFDSFNILSGLQRANVQLRNAKKAQQEQKAQERKEGSHAEGG